MSMETNDYAYEEQDGLPFDADPDETYEMQNTFGNYLKKIGKVALLSAEEEVELAKQIEAGLYAEKILEASMDEEHEYRERWDSLENKYKRSRQPLRIAIREGQEARHHMIMANLRLSVSIAKRYTGHGVPLDDLVQEGNAGLMRAVDGFDYRKGFKFSTYATWWIRQAITREMGEQRDNTLRLPVHIIEKQSKITTAKRALRSEIGREPTHEEIAHYVGMGAEELETLLQYGKDMVSLDMQVGTEERAVLGEFLYDETAATVDEIIEYDLVRNAIDKVLSRLDEREAKVIRLRMGLSGNKPMKLSEIGEYEGVSAEWVRQLEQRALRKLRKTSISRELSDLVD